MNRGDARIFFMPIGIVSSPLKIPGTPPIQSTFSQVEGTIEILPEYREGLLGIEGFSHLIILSYFHCAAHRALIEKPLIDGEEQHGIFTTRHFNRPNPIGISSVELVKATRGTLYVRGIDLLDRTPVLDIKPYIPAFDSIPDAATGWVTAEHIDRIRVISTRAGSGPGTDRSSP